MDYALEMNEKCDGFFNCRSLVDAYTKGASDALAEQWIDPKVELPEMLTRVLVCIKEPYGSLHVHICKRIYHDTTNPKNDKWHWSNVAKDSDVVAWMPLPNPAKIIDNANK